jgi:hypothetical protein
MSTGRTVSCNVTQYGTGSRIICTDWTVGPGPANAQSTQCTLMNNPPATNAVFNTSGGCDFHVQSPVAGCRSHDGTITRWYFGISETQVESECTGDWMVVPAG